MLEVRIHVRGGELFGIPATLNPKPEGFLGTLNPKPRFRSLGIGVEARSCLFLWPQMVQGAPRMLRSETCWSQILHEHIPKTPSIQVMPTWALKPLNGNY